MSKQYLINETTLTDIADAIRVKTGGTETIIVDNFPEVIASIDTQEDLDPELATQNDLIEQIATTLSCKITENLDEELSEQDDLIAQIAIALEGKTGATYDTCTIVVQDSSGADYTPLGDFLVTRIVDGVVTTDVQSGSRIENVLCNSVIVYDNEDYFVDESVDYNNLTALNAVDNGNHAMYVFATPALHGSTAIITIGF